jgi:hypothetical protein
MAEIWEGARRRLAPVSLRVWPALSNPAWRSASASRVFGDRLKVSVTPSRLQRKIDPDATNALKGRFLVDGLDAMPSSPVNELCTYRDMEDIARHGEDWRSTRLGKWLLAGIQAARPAFVRGTRITNDAEIEAYYRGYLAMFRSMREIGYRYQGDDEMCIGVCGDGGLVLVRRGTHRLAAAQILGLAVVTGRITQIDRRFALDARQRFVADSPIEAIARAVAEAAAA